MSFLYATITETKHGDDLDTRTLELEDPSYPWHVEQIHNGWPASGYEWQRTSVKVRRVTNPDRQEVQFELGIEQMKGKRLFEHTASFSVPLTLATKLARVLSPDSESPAMAALEALHTAVHSGVNAAPKLYAEAERLYAIAKAETPAPSVTHAELLAALVALVECPDYRGIGTHEMNAARVIVAKAKGV